MPVLTIAMLGDIPTRYAELYAALDDAGHQVATAPYADAMQLMLRLRPQVVVLEVDPQPDHPGYAVLAHLATQPPVLVLVLAALEPSGPLTLDHVRLPAAAILVPTPCAPSQVLTLLAAVRTGSSGGTTALADSRDGRPARLTHGDLDAAARESLATLREQVEITLRLVHTTQAAVDQLRYETTRIRSTTAALRQASADLLAQGDAGRHAWEMGLPRSAAP